MRALRLAFGTHGNKYQCTKVETVPSYEGIATFSGAFPNRDLKIAVVETVPSYEGIATGYSFPDDLIVLLKLSRVMRALLLNTNNLNTAFCLC